jgi:hypothetical protein
MTFKEYIDPFAGGVFCCFDPCFKQESQANRKQIASKIYTLKRGFQAQILRLTTYLCSTMQ